MSGDQSFLKKALERLQASAQKIIETRGYTKESEKLRILEELIKEQLGNEHPAHSNRPLR